MTPHRGQAMLPRPPRSAGWLGSPPGSAWVDDGDPNPFVRWRTLLWSYAAAQRAGWSDSRFVDVVRSLDDAVAGVAGTGFRVTPLSWEGDLGAAVRETTTGSAATATSARDATLSAATATSARDATGSPTTVNQAIALDLAIKDETGNVAGSHKARHLFGLLLHLAVDDVPLDRPLAISSCGNAALGAATVARAAGRPLDVFIPTWADPVVVDRLNELGARITVCERRSGEAGDPCYLRFRDAVAAGAYPFGCQGTENLLTIDGGRTLGWELATQVPTARRLLVQVGGGALGSSLSQGWCDALDAGVVDRLPAAYPIQTEGCAPLERAVKAALVEGGSPERALQLAAAEPDRFMTPWPDPQSAATGILDDVTYDWVPLAWAVWSTDGAAVVAPESAVVTANELAARHTSIPADTTGTAGLAGLLSCPDLGPDDTGPTVVLFTGARR